MRQPTTVAAGAAAGSGTAATGRDAVRWRLPGHARRPGDTAFPRGCRPAGRRPLGVLGLGWLRCQRRAGRGHAHLRSGEFTREAFDAAVVRPFVDQISGQSLKGRLLRNAWKLVGPKTRTELLAEEFDELFLHDRLLEDLDPDVRFIINAADTSTGVRFGFERDVIGDYVVGQIPTAGTRLRLSTAVAASAAVPGPFPPLTPKGLPQFPCQQGRTIRLVDGGAYDNMGLEPVDDLRDAFLLAVNAGGVFVTGDTAGCLSRATSNWPTRCSIGSRRRCAAVTWWNASRRTRTSRRSRRAVRARRRRTGPGTASSSG